jgi:hypothetical protein
MYYARESKILYFNFTERSFETAMNISLLFAFKRNQLTTHAQVTLVEKISNMYQSTARRSSFV